jgi:P27 family predicted phage terminase small subunit
MKPKWRADPPGLVGEARKVWDYHAAALAAAGNLSPGNAEEFASLCRLIAIARAAQTEIDRDGITILLPSGAKRPHPAANLLLRAERQLRPLLQQFGLDQP